MKILRRLVLPGVICVLLCCHISCNRFERAHKKAGFELLNKVAWLVEGKEMNRIFPMTKVFVLLPP